ncbi:hypothetical protein [Lacinutrix jangbogonensis]|uniref:hypothetical protein n=1 Tax=Lacinutrix jangbogonensis TaxID=1469557 RepID=UPI00068ECB5E|nr:hypothetical protein [Lacinutrix jangbogonensis]
MKKILLIAAFVLTASFASAQSLNYQAAARDVSGNLIIQENLGVQVRILSGTNSGPEVFAETWTVTTNTNGVFDLAIGEGANVSGDLSTLNWGAVLYFLEIAIDETGGNMYAVVGTSQLKFTPMAINSKAAIAQLELEKAPLASPAFTGDITMVNSLVHSANPTRDYLRFVGNNGTQLAAQTFLRLKINNADKLVVLSDKIYSTVPIGIGTVLPSADLDIVGSFQYEDGNEGVGKVLTSDVDGLASWADAATGTDNQTAAEVPSMVTGDIEATNVDAAIAELEAEKAPLASPR